MLDEQSLVVGLNSVTELVSYRPGDRVKTLRGSIRGVVLRLLPDGRVAWQPDGGKSELVALPENLLPDKSRNT